MAAASAHDSVTGQGASWSHGLCVSLRYQDIDRLDAPGVLMAVDQEPDQSEAVASLDLCGNLVSGTAMRACRRQRWATGGTPAPRRPLALVIPVGIPPSGRFGGRFMISVLPSPSGVLQLRRTNRRERDRGLEASLGLYHAPQRQIARKITTLAFLNKLFFRWNDRFEEIQRRSARRRESRFSPSPAPLRPPFPPHAHAQVTDLAGISSYPRLVSLSLAQNQLSDLGAAAFAPTLTHLDLSNNQLVSLAGLEALPFLSWLDVTSNRLASLRPLSRCYRLRTLLAGHNRLTTVLGVEGLDKLERLQLHGNRLRGEAELRLLAALPRLNHLTLRGNPLERPRRAAGAHPTAVGCAAPGSSGASTPGGKGTGWAWPGGAATATLATTGGWPLRGDGEAAGLGPGGARARYAPSAAPSSADGGGARAAAAAAAAALKAKVGALMPGLSTLDGAPARPAGPGPGAPPARAAALAAADPESARWHAVLSAPLFDPPGLVDPDTGRLGDGAHPTVDCDYAPDEALAWLREASGRTAGLVAAADADAAGASWGGPSDFDETPADDDVLPRAAGDPWTTPAARGARDGAAAAEAESRLASSVRRGVGPSPRNASAFLSPSRRGLHGYVSPGPGGRAHQTVLVASGAAARRNASAAGASAADVSVWAPLGDPSATPNNRINNARDDGRDPEVHARVQESVGRHLARLQVAREQEEADRVPKTLAGWTWTQGGVVGAGRSWGAADLDQTREGGDNPDASRRFRDDAPLLASPMGRGGYGKPVGLVVPGGASAGLAWGGGHGAPSPQGGMSRRPGHGGGGRPAHPSGDGTGDSADPGRGRDRSHLFLKDDSDLGLLGPGHGRGEGSPGLHDGLGGSRAATTGAEADPSAREVGDEPEQDGGVVPAAPATPRGGSRPTSPGTARARAERAAAVHARRAVEAREAMEAQYSHALRLPGGVKGRPVGWVPASTAPGAVPEAGARGGSPRRRSPIRRRRGAKGATAPVATTDPEYEEEKKAAAATPIEERKPSYAAVVGGFPDDLNDSGGGAPVHASRDLAAMALGEGRTSFRDGLSGGGTGHDASGWSAAGGDDVAPASRAAAGGGSLEKALKLHLSARSGTGMGAGSSTGGGIGRGGGEKLTLTGTGPRGTSGRQG